MSYILEALKKSERQRPPGPVPDLFTVHGPLLPRSRRLPWLMLGAVAVVACATGFGIWIGTSSGKRAEAPGPVPIPVAPRAAAVPVTAPLRKPFEAPHPVRGNRPMPRPLQRRSAMVLIEPPPVPAQVPAPAADASPTSVASPVTTPVAGPVTGPVAAPETVPVPTQTASIAVADQPREESPPLASATPTVAPRVVPDARAVREPPASPPPPELPPPDGRVLGFAELPAAVRGEIGEATLSGHIWSEDPSLRMVTIQDRLFREGADLRPGLRLEQITPTGAILGFMGYRLRIESGSR